MGRPRNDWQGYLNKLLRHYPNELTREGTPKAIEAREAIKKSIEETISKYPDGLERVAFFDLVYFRHTHTLYGAAMMVNVSEATGKRWSREFIRTCAKNIGFIKN